MGEGEGDAMKLFTAFGMFMSMAELRLADKQHAGWRGWDKIAPVKLKARLLHNIETEDWVDVANLAMFLWARRWKDENKAFSMRSGNTPTT
jgi:hypothetical protein